MLTRRTLLKQAALLTGMSISGRGFTKTAPVKTKLHIGACDWSIGKSSDIGAFEVAKTIGLEGIQVNLGSEANDLHLRQRERQRAYLEESSKTGVKITSLAIGELNKIPYKSDPRTDEWVWDSVDVAHNLDVPVVLLAFFANNDLRGDDRGKQEVVRKLKEVAPRAEKMNVILGIESYLTAEEHMDIIDQVGSKSIKVYYDFRNSADAGNDVIKEIQWLGRDAICELHMKENGFLLGQGTMDWRKIAETLTEMKYRGDGWMQIEGARPQGADIVESYKHNLHFLQNLFHT
ncbi:MAG TPA: sugar phosphate isomerase/epimerase family protein [Chryseosolibacter sp.]|nr:sugar phosphate isomerase/epimerase family protein [Chryseosolibacter sp.]